MRTRQQMARIRK